MTPISRIIAIAPQRFSWLPGRVEGAHPAPPVFEYREANGTDWPALTRSVARHCVIDPGWVSRIRTESNGVARVVVRNLRHQVAGALSWHRPDSNDVRAIYVSEKYRGRPGYPDLLDDLLTLAALELPEAPTRVWVPEHDSWTQTAISRLGGWHGNATKDGRYVRFRHGPVRPAVRPR